MKVERPFFLQGLLCVSRVTIFHAKGIRNRRRVFRLPRQFNKNASVPRFVNPKIISVRIKLRGKSKEGGRSPLLGRFKGIAKGRGLPRESSEAIRVGKGGTTERTRPVRRKRRTGCGMWSLFRRNSPLTMLSFDRQRRFLSHMRKKAGLKPSLFCQDRKEWIAGGIPIDFSIVTCYTSIVNHKR